MKRRLKQLRCFGHSVGEQEPTVQLVTFIPGDDILAIFVQADQDASKHEKSAIHVWGEWQDDVPGPRVHFRLFNLSECVDEQGKQNLLEKYAGEILFDRR